MCQLDVRQLMRYQSCLHPLNLERSYSHRKIEAYTEPIIFMGHSPNPQVQPGVSQSMEMRG